VQQPLACVSVCGMLAAVEFCSLVGIPTCAQPLLLPGRPPQERLRMRQFSLRPVASMTPKPAPLTVQSRDLLTHCITRNILICIRRWNRDYRPGPKWAVARPRRICCRNLGNSLSGKLARLRECPLRIVVPV